jgi:ATP-binding cassette subfamily A (ABC1) protein 1
MMQELSLTPHMDKLAMTLSGGNKRKLSLAIAMMGSPPLIFLDEPSTGVDPAARRLMWNVIAGVTTVRHKCSVMLTTHNMEEAEALCTRIGIMVGGRLRCIGSNQHLKSKFSNGYQLEVRLKYPAASQCDMSAAEWGLQMHVMPGDLMQLCSKLGCPHRVEWVREGCEQGHMIYEAFKAGPVPARTFVEWWLLEDRAEHLADFLQEKFPGTLSLERHDRSLRFRLPAACPAGLGGIFRCLEAARAEYQVEDYGISQTNLEQIFNEFASQQQEETAPVQGIFMAGREVACSPEIPGSISMIDVGDP